MKNTMVLPAHCTSISPDDKAQLGGGFLITTAFIGQAVVVGSVLYTFRALLPNLFIRTVRGVVVFTQGILGMFFPKSTVQSLNNTAANTLTAVTTSPTVSTSGSSASSSSSGSYQAVPTIQL